MAMNVATPEHLAAIDLLDNESNDPETDRQAMINFLLFQSLQQVATMPFTIMMENWRYAVFNGTFTEDQWMEKFWEMKNEWVGVKAPAERTEKCELYSEIVRYQIKCINPDLLLTRSGTVDLRLLHANI